MNGLYTFLLQYNYDDHKKRATGLVKLSVKPKNKFRNIENNSFFFVSLSQNFLDNI